MNLVAYAWGLDNLGPGDLVLVTELEHHSNFVPWQAIARRTGAEFALLPVDAAGELQLDALDGFAGRNVKVVASGLVSNSLGTVNDVPRIAAWAHEHGAICVVDAAQAAPHRVIDVQTLGADFIAVSGPQDVRAERDWLSLGSQRVAARDVAVPLRRPHDPARRRCPSRGEAPRWPKPRALPRRRSRVSWCNSGWLRGQRRFDQLHPI